jgi:CO dehydrogenase/acetyl-CoA synthase beta subunit
MKLFEPVIGEIRDYVNGLRARTAVRGPFPADAGAWPGGTGGNVVLQQDTAVELGSPRDESIAFVVWTSDLSLVNDGMITLAGPDLRDNGGKGLPFGKVVILGVMDFNEDNCFDLHREIELLRYDLNLSGYMMRAVSQYGREWSRVSKRAVEGGFKLGTLGGALLRMYRSKPFVAAAEAVFVTSSPEDVRMLSAPFEKASRLIGALNKMASELSLDCDDCDYSDVCSEVEGLRSMRATLEREKKNG